MREREKVEGYGGKRKGSSERGMHRGEETERTLLGIWGISLGMKEGEKSKSERWMQREPDKRMKGRRSEV